MENNLTYTRNGDYLIPDLSLSEQPEKPLGKYGRMRKAYLKEHRPLIYNQLLLTEKLYPHLLEIDETANSRLEQMIPQLAESAGATEELGGPDEHLQGPSGGDFDGGAYQQLTLNLFLSEAEQIQRIDEAENVKTSSAFSFAQEQPQPDPAVWEYNGVKERHPDDMVLYQMGDFFEIYGEDAKEAAPELGLKVFRPLYRP